jgi:inhibitor of cysteine peptidase
MIITIKGGMKMRLRVILAFIVVATSLSPLSCITLRRANVEISCNQFYENHHQRSELHTAVRDTIAVKLCSNPTTGFQWEYVMSEGSVLQEEEHDYKEPEGDAPGTAGKEVWIFRAVEKGTTEVHMEYSQPWEGGEKAEWTFTMTVIVE